MRKLRKMLYLKLARMGRGSTTPVPSIISFGTKIKGHIVDGDIIHVDGRIDGNIRCEELIIGIRGQVSGQVNAKSLSIYGTLLGTAEAENVFIAGTSKVVGDIHHKTLAIEPGAYIEGRCVRNQADSSNVNTGKDNNNQAAAKAANVVEDSTLFKAVSGGK